MSPFILSGGNIDPKVTPIHVPGGDPGGSFFSPPFVLYDAFYQIAFLAGHQPWFGFTPSLGELQLREADGVIRPITSVPLQWFEDIPTPPVTDFYSARRILDLGPDPWNGPGPVPDLGVWAPMGVSSVVFSMLSFAGGSQREATTTFEMALTSDTSTVLARATIHFLWTRP